MTTVFISHSTRDDEFVNKLAESLHQQQYKTWIDHQDTPEGMLWANVIQDGLERGDHMILLMDESSLQSRHVRIEWQSFQALVKPIIMLIMEEGVEIPRLLQDYPSVNWTSENDFNQKFMQLLKFLPLPRTSQVFTTTPDPTKSIHTRQLNPNATGLNELQKLAAEIDNRKDVVENNTDVKIIIPKSDVSLSYSLGSKLVIGRASPMEPKKPDIDLNPYESIKTVSRYHATLHLDNNKLILTDIGSSNGTFIGGERLSANDPQAIISGTMVRFGALIVQIMHGND